MIDGAENNMRSFHSSRHFEAAGFWSETRHSYAPDILVMSRASLLSLTPADRELLMRTARESVPVIRSLRDSAERVRRHEMEHALKLLARGEDPANVLDQLSHRLTNKLLHAPTQNLSHAEGDRSELQALVMRLFNLHHD